MYVIVGPDADDKLQIVGRFHNWRVASASVAQLNKEAKMTPDEQKEAQRRLASQWPKKCGCGREYSIMDWLGLSYAFVYRDAFADQEHRHCSCGSTIAVYTKIHDLKAE